MDRFIYRSDLAVDLKEQTMEEFTDDYQSYEENSIKVEKITLENDNQEFNKKKGIYLSLRFEDLEIEANRENIIDVLTKELIKVFNNYTLNKVLIVGLGNQLLSVDAVGPLLQDGLIVTSHLNEELIHNENLKKVALLIPRVKGQTGMETFSIVKGVCEEFHPDLVIAVDALATSSMNRLHKVIQVTDTGIHPGSGVGNNTKEINMESLNVPVIAIGVPTVVDVASISYDVIELMERYFADNILNPSNKLKFGLRKDYDGELTEEQKISLFGEIGKLTDQEKKQLLLEITTPVGLNMIVTSKSVDEEVKVLSSIIAHSLNHAIHH